EISDVENRFVDRVFVFAFGEKILLRASDHLRDQFIVAGARDVAGSDAASVAQDSEAIGDLAHLFEEVTDVNDGDAFGTEAANQLEEISDVVALQAAGWFIHQDDTR